MQSKLKISIVIPVYNEADHIAACLEAIESQTVRPYEVIVVDNNSDDETVAIAQRYPHVRVLHEARQGVVHARNRGFGAARGDVIGRIDADTILAPDWVANLQTVMAADQSIAAIGGSARYYDLALPQLMNRVDLTIRRYLAVVMGRQIPLQGANMAIRRSVWRRISSQTCSQPGLHEDFDIAIHVASHGYRVVFDPRLVAHIGYRQVEAPFKQFARYMLICSRTYAVHGLPVRRYLYPIISLVILSYWPLKIFHHGYDRDKQRFSVSRLLQMPPEVRVNPATYTIE